MGPAALVTALAGAAAFLALAVASYAALRAEQARKDARRALEARARPQPCRRAHASEVAALWLARERASTLTEEPLEAEDLPAMRGATREVVDEDEVNPRIGQMRRRGPP